MDLIATDKFWGSNVLVEGFQGFSQTIFWRFLFMVAAVLDNDNDFFEVRKKIVISSRLHQPQQAREDSTREHPTSN